MDHQEVRDRDKDAKERGKLYADRNVVLVKVR